MAAIRGPVIGTADSMGTADAWHPLPMPVAVFENRSRASLTLVVEPWGDRYEIPPLATAGVRYMVKPGQEDYSTSVVGDGEIEFRCNADDYEVDVVPASVYDRLLWDICVNWGFCGGILEGEPTHVSDLLPSAGTVDAEPSRGWLCGPRGTRIRRAPFPVRGNRGWWRNSLHISDLIPFRSIC